VRRDYEIIYFNHHPGEGVGNEIHRYAITRLLAEEERRGDIYRQMPIQDVSQKEGVEIV